MAGPLGESIAGTPFFMRFVCTNPKSNYHFKNKRFVV